MLYRIDFVVSGRTELLADFRTKAIGHLPRYADSAPPRQSDAALALSLHALVPVPPTVLERPYLSIEGGWEWELLHWGCTFGIFNLKVILINPEQLLYSFCATRPPLEFVLWVSASFPAIEFRLSWEEEDGEWCSVLVQAGSVVSILW